MATKKRDKYYKDDEKTKLKRDCRSQKKWIENAFENLVSAGMKPIDIQKIFGSRTVAEKEGNIAAYDRSMVALEACLYGHMISKAIGYKFTETKTTYAYETDNETKKKKWVATKREETEKLHPGSDVAMIFLLTNRFGDNWKNTKELITRKEGYDSNPTDRARKQIESLSRDVLEADTIKPERELVVSGGPA